MSDQKQHDLSTREGCFEAFLEQKRRAEELQFRCNTFMRGLEDEEKESSFLSDQNAALEAEIATLKATVQRLEAPVSDAEWRESYWSDDGGMRGFINTFIAARATPPAKEQPVPPQKEEQP